MFCASPVLLNLTVIKCKLGLIKSMLCPSFAQPVLFVLSFVNCNVFNSINFLSICVDCNAPQHFRILPRLDQVRNKRPTPQ